MKDEEDVRVVVAFTEVDVAAVKWQARKDGTLAILKGLME